MSQSQLHDAYEVTAKVEFHRGQFRFIARKRV